MIDSGVLTPEYNGWTTLRICSHTNEVSPKSLIMLGLTTRVGRLPSLCIAILTSLNTSPVWEPVTSGRTKEPTF